jgi:signal peptidase I
MNRILFLAIAVALTTPLVSEAGWRDYLPYRRLTMAQNGMYPEFPKDSSLVAKSGFMFKTDEVARGDIIIFNVQLETGTALFLWRVIGLPGDKVQITKQGVVVNGTSLKTKLLDKDGAYEIYEEANNGVTYRVAYKSSLSAADRKVLQYEVPQKHFFVMGDNRDNAMDSRLLGFISFTKTVGVVKNNRTVQD